MTPERFMQRVSPEPNSGCWIWMGALGRLLYGKATHEGKDIGAHRLSYKLLRGDIPEGMVLDHLCRNPWCVNPAHLEAVTQRVNAMRGMTIAARNAAKTHCKRGHAFDEANTVSRQGRRHCRSCERASYRERYYRLDMCTAQRLRRRAKRDAR